MPPPYDPKKMRRLMEAQTGILQGFLDDHDRIQFPHVVLLQGLCPAALGYPTFARLLHICIRAAVEYAPLKFHFEAFRADHQRAGYYFRFARQAPATRFSVRYNAALSTLSVNIAGPRRMTGSE